MHQLIDRKVIVYMVRFGTAGNPPMMYSYGYNNTASVFEFLSRFGLDAYEYECTRSVSTSSDTAQLLGNIAKQHDIMLSVHAPYYISIGSPEKHKVENSMRNILESMRIAKFLGARLVVFHPGTNRYDYRNVIKTAKETLKEVIIRANNEGYTDVILSPESAGKVSQLGNIDDLIELSSVDDCIVPTLDFAHLYACSNGRILIEEEIEKVFDKIVSGIGKDKCKLFHIHYSQIFFSTYGEKSHGTLLDDTGPNFTALANVLRSRNYNATIICESNGRQAEDAIVYKNIYQGDVNNESTSNSSV